MQPKMNMETFLAAVGNRLRDVEAHFRNRSLACESAGVSKSTFQRWVNGESDPSFSGLAAIGAETGISLDWIATGKGDMYGRAAVRPSPGTRGAADTIDEELLGSLAGGIAAVHGEAAVEISPTQCGRMAARLLNQLMAAYDDPAERRIGVKVLLQQLRADLSKRGGVER